MRTKNPGLVTKPQAKVKLIELEKLLRRRKTTLADFLLESGITTYSLLVERCERMGCHPPTQERFDSLPKGWVSSPTEGVVVVAPTVVEPSIEVITEQQTETNPTEDPAQEAVFPPEEFLKKNRRKRSSGDA